MTMVKIYGIKNCDTMRKARKWLDTHNVVYDFHDYKTQGIDAETLSRWADLISYEKLLNKNGTTFRKLPEAEKTDLTKAQAVILMQTYPSLIKRPVIEYKEKIETGFNPEKYAMIFS
ncbi:arsenate reductase [Acetobacter thailandicus]|uniref:arsenate reductase n=1 Tax=Acetobacter thailandicus TaxID=1502842 RepID=UPI001BA57F00|nr:arsenate reductase [Acetobacter thailandicus]MBS1004502.1 arsenate reductase [Acetobacter thailandicus]